VVFDGHFAVGSCRPRTAPDGGFNNDIVVFGDSGQWRAWRGPGGRPFRLAGVKTLTRPFGDAVRAIWQISLASARRSTKKLRFRGHYACSRNTRIRGPLKIHTCHTKPCTVEKLKCDFSTSSNKATVPCNRGDIVTRMIALLETTNVNVGLQQYGVTHPIKKYEFLT